MANTVETDWDESSPNLSQTRRAGAAEILALRKGVRLRMSREHEELDISGAGGEHLAGSAKAYAQDAEPTLRPDTTTLLDTDDKGRLWYETDTGRAWWWNGSAWIAVNYPSSEFFAAVNASPFTIPFAQTGLASGGYSVMVYGCAIIAASTTSTTISVTVAGVTKTLAITSPSEGAIRHLPFVLPFHVSPTAGSISVTAASNCNVQGMTGHRITF